MVFTVFVLLTPCAIVMLRKGLLPVDVCVDVRVIFVFPFSTITYCVYDLENVISLQPSPNVLD